MATLYATQTHRGLQCSWTGTDLTGLAGTALRATFKSKTDNTTFVGTGSFSAPVVTTVNGVITSTFNYTPSASDIALSNVGEWFLQVRALFGDATLDFSTPDVVEIKAPY